MLGPTRTSHYTLGGDTAVWTQHRFLQALARVCAGPPPATPMTVPKQRSLWHGALRMGEDLTLNALSFLDPTTASITAIVSPTDTPSMQCIRLNQADLDLHGGRGAARPFRCHRPTPWRT